jgi:hypothetical protein
MEFIVKPSALSFKLTYSTLCTFPHPLVLVIILSTSSSTLVQSELYLKICTYYEALHYQVVSKLMFCLCPFVLQSCQCHTACRVGCRIYGIYGSGCGIIKVQSWHFPEGAELSYETYQDR